MESLYTVRIILGLFVLAVAYVCIRVASITTNQDLELEGAPVPSTRPNLLNTIEELETTDYRIYLLRTVNQLFSIRLKEHLIVYTARLRSGDLDQMPSKSMRFSILTCRAATIRQTMVSDTELLLIFLVAITFLASAFCLI